MKPIKSIFAVSLSFLLLFSLCLNAFAKGGATCWFIKHSGENQPRIPEEAEYIYDYDGYYLDKKLTPESETKKLYLTFDFGYENGNTEKIVNTLAEKQVPAAFFVLDHVILENTELIKRMASNGHLICNHTKNHIDLTKCSADEIRKNLSALEDIYTEKTGLEMAKYFRFPEGKYSEEAIKCVSSLGYKTIFWSFAYADWDNRHQPSAEFAMKKILSNTHNGAVILLHPNSATNAQILPKLIDKWRSMGYEFGTLDELTTDL